MTFMFLKVYGRFQDSWKLHFYEISLPTFLVQGQGCLTMATAYDEKMSVISLFNIVFIG